MADLKALRAILDKIAKGEVSNHLELGRAKIWACRELGLESPPKNSELLAAATDEGKDKLLKLLRLKPVRSISGVSVITVMPKPTKCPKAEPCIYCPGGPGQNTPQSYTGKEPAAARALQCDYDPHAQVKGRIEQLRAIGHDVDKVELIVFGGTLTAYPRDYLEWFTTQCLNATSGSNAANIVEAQAAAEAAPIRVSDVTFETRPDYCKEPHVDLLLDLGATRVELGVQTLFEDIYKIVKRGHTVEDVVEATRIARDSGLAVIYHLMPNLPGSTYERDLEMFKKVFEDEGFRPDALKIYPTLVMENTELHAMFLRGEHVIYDFEKLVELIVKVKKLVPRWTRIQRIQRDIPANLIIEGVKRGDLRALVQRKLQAEGGSCKCIRCREVGHLKYKDDIAPDLADIKLTTEKYRASDGEEVFLSFRDVKQDILIGLLRLRNPSRLAHRPESKTTRCSLVRELHVYGPMVAVGKKAAENEWQHSGWGERLLSEAERISQEDFDAKKSLVLAGIGTRNYYRHLGYEREGPYMAKSLRD